MRTVVNPGKLVTTDVLDRYTKLLATGFSPEAAKASLEAAESAASGAVVTVMEEVKKVEDKVDSLDAKVSALDAKVDAKFAKVDAKCNVGVGLLLAVLVCLPLNTIPNTLLGAALRLVLG